MKVVDPTPRQPTDHLFLFLFCIFFYSSPKKRTEEGVDSSKPNLDKALGDGDRGHRPIQWLHYLIRLTGLDSTPKNIRR